MAKRIHDWPAHDPIAFPEFQVRGVEATTVELLLHHGSNVNQQCKRSGSTPLHRAVTWSGAPATAGKGDDAREIIEILLRHGADPTIKNKLGKTEPTMCATPTLGESC